MIDEQSYIEGSRRTSMQVLQTILPNLSEEMGREAGRILERQEAVAALRQVCADFGDNDWPDDLHLRDVIEKHLACHLGER